MAQAYGTNHVYQLTYSLNCDNKASPLCAPNAFGLGGAWGWIEPDSDGTVDPGGNYIVFDPSSAIGFIAFPATPGHYSQSLGAGIQTQATVKLMH